MPYDDRNNGPLDHVAEILRFKSANFRLITEEPFMKATRKCTFQSPSSHS